MYEHDFPINVLIYATGHSRSVVQFQVGRMHNLNGQLRKVRGSSIVLTVDPDSTADELLPLAVNKHCACNWHLERNAVYRLLYPDGQVVDKVPGTDEAFTLARYKVFLGKAYLKVALFICEEDDYIASKQKLL